jgi:magnesium-transporting ATPase (P-type)
MSTLAASAALNSAPCALTLNVDTSLYSITQLIREARTLGYNGRQGFSFYLTCQLSMCFIMLLSYCALLPPIFTGYQIIFVTWLLFPWISMSFFFSPYDSEIMIHQPVKNSGHLKDKWRFFFYFTLRVSLPVFFCVGLFIAYIYFKIEK